MFWIERLLGIDLGIWSWVGDFLLISIGVLGFIDGDKRQRGWMAALILLGFMVFGAVWFGR